MKDFIIVSMAEKDKAISTKHIIAVCEPHNGTGSEIYVLDMVNPYYSSKSVRTVLNEIGATY